MAEENKSIVQKLLEEKAKNESDDYKKQFWECMLSLYDCEIKYKFKLDNDVVEKDEIDDAIICYLNAIKNLDENFANLIKILNQKKFPVFIKTDKKEFEFEKWIDEFFKMFGINHELLKNDVFDFEISINITSGHEVLSLGSFEAIKNNIINKLKLKAENEKIEGKKLNFDENEKKVFHVAFFRLARLIKEKNDNCDEIKKLFYIFIKKDSFIKKDYLESLIENQSDLNNIFDFFITEILGKILFIKTGYLKSVLSVASSSMSSYLIAFNSYILEYLIDTSEKKIYNPLIGKILKRIFFHELGHSFGSAKDASNGNYYKDMKCEHGNDCIMFQPDSISNNNRLRYAKLIKLESPYYCKEHYDSILKRLKPFYAQEKSLDFNNIFPRPKDENSENNTSSLSKDETDSVKDVVDELLPKE